MFYKGQYKLKVEEILSVFVPKNLYKKRLKRSVSRWFFCTVLDRISVKT
jgi:hypothetical protein